MSFKEVRRKRSEYGGFLPLELNPGKEYFENYEDVLRRFNSVKAALNFLIRWLGDRQDTIYIPYYYCPSTIESISATGIKIQFYHIDSTMMPIDLPDKSNSMIILVDYFGICTDEIEQFAYTFKNAEVILDRAHAFYAKPIMKEKLYNLYSAKKFFGVPDGAYLISKTILPNEQVPTVAYDYIKYLVISYEMGTNAAYTMKKETDRILAANYGCMSNVAMGLLKNVEYDRVKKYRTDNYAMLYESFRKFNELVVPQKCAAYQFPLLISDGGEEIKSNLIRDKIFVSTLWAGKDLLENGSEVEINLMKNTIFLPVDQRYDVEDMAYMISRVKVYLGRILK